MKRSSAWLMALSLIGALLVAGCSGDTGNAGAPAPTSGNIAGTVTDAVKGDPLAGVTVTAKDSSTPPATLATATTDASGNYALSGVPIGPVSVYFAKTYYTSPPGMTVSVLGGITTTINAGMSEAASGGPSATLAAAAPYDDYGYGGSALLVAAATDPNDNAALLKYAWSNQTALTPRLGTVTVNPADNTQATVGFPTVLQAMAPRTDNTNPGGDTSGYKIPDRFGVLPVITDTRGTVTAQVKVDDLRGRSATVKISLNAASIVTGNRNVPLRTRIYLNSGHDNTNSWSLTPPAGSSAAIVDGATRFASFVPDAAGAYVLAEGSNTMTVYAGAWKGVITGTSGGDTIALDTYCTNCHNDAAAVDEFTPWAQTPHATMFTRGVDGGNGSSYGASCITCHTVGYDKGVANGGFDDLMAQYGWTFPAALAPTNWANMFPAFENVARLANIQCENCHGPNTSDAHQLTFDNAAGAINEFASPRISYAAELCATCHASGSGHHLYSEWATPSATGAGHSNLQLARDEGTSKSCGRCHGAQGFPVFLDQLASGNMGNINNPQIPLADQVPWASVTDNNIQPITCQACHDPHDISNPNQLRVYGDTAVLPAGFKVVGAGKGALCITCHNTRNGTQSDNVSVWLHEDTTTYARQAYSAPHTASQGDIFAGRNAWFFDNTGANLPMLSKHAAVEDTCVGCHMKLNPKTHLSHGSPVVNSHLFRIESADVATVCANCHGSSVNGEAIIAATEAGLAAIAAQLDAQARPYMNGLGSIYIDNAYLDTPDEPTVDNTVVDTVANPILKLEIAEVHGQASLRFTMTSAVTFPGATTNVFLVQLGSLYTSPSKATNVFAKKGNVNRAIWNYLLVEGDDSFGLHNPGFVQAIINRTLTKNLNN